MVLYARSNENTSEDHVNNPENLDLVSYCSQKKIAKGEQLFIDYGMNYWKNKVNNFANITNEELKEAIRNYKKSDRKVKNKKRGK